MQENLWFDAMSDNVTYRKEIYCNLRNSLCCWFIVQKMNWRRSNIKLFCLQGEGKEVVPEGRSQSQEMTSLLTGAQGQLPEVKVPGPWLMLSMLLIRHLWSFLVPPPRFWYQFTWTITVSFHLTCFCLLGFWFILSHFLLLKKNSFKK